MADFQWLVMAVVAIVAVIATIYFGIQNLRNVITQRERDSGYASGRVEVKLENLEHLLRVVNDKLDAHDRKLDAHDVKLDAHGVLLRQIRREAKKQGRRLRKLRKRVEVLESSGPVPPTDPTSTESAAVTTREGPRLAAVAGRDSAVERSDRGM